MCQFSRQGTEWRIGLKLNEAFIFRNSEMPVAESKIFQNRTEIRIMFQHQSVLGWRPRFGRHQQHTGGTWKNGGGWESLESMTSMRKRKRG